MKHRVYKAIISAVNNGSLVGPFSAKEFIDACPGFASGTYRTFLAKHAEGNPGGNSELFIRVGRGRYKCLRPFKYDV